MYCSTGLANSAASSAAQVLSSWQQTLGFGPQLRSMQLQVLPSPMLRTGPPMDALVGCLEAGLGATLLPRSLLERAADAGRLRLTPVCSEIGRVETQFIRRRDAGDFSAIRALLQELGAVVTPSVEGDQTAV